MRKSYEQLSLILQCFQNEPVVFASKFICCKGIKSCREHGKDLSFQTFERIVPKGEIVQGVIFSAKMF